MSAELPARIAVRISSEAAGDISITPVITEQIAPRDLVEAMLGVCGKDANRISELLKRGSLVQGASRFRWTGFEAPIAQIENLLHQFPDADPAIEFDPARCIHARFSGPKSTVEVSRELGSARRLLRRTSFWDELMKQAAASRPKYHDYSYREKADIYRINGAPSELKLLRYDGLIQQIERAQVQQIELFCRRL